jgi:hypothetical protein
MSGVATKILLDGNGQDMAVRHVQDVEPILEHNKMLRTLDQPSDWGRHIASIPNVVYIKWLDEEYAKGNTTLRPFTREFDELVERKLKDPDWAYLRTDRPALQAGWSAGLA